MTAPAVIVRVQGGLGNQLFQHAAARTLAQRTGISDVRYDMTGELWPAGNPNLPDVLPGPFPPASGLDAVLPPPNRITPLEALAWPSRMTLRRIRATQTIRGREFDPIPRDLHGPRYYLDGYFQHPGWYEPALDEVLAGLLRYGPLSDGAPADPPDVAIAFRRSDYVRLGWELGDDYFVQALEELSVGAGTRVRVVCDDRHFAAWVRRALSGTGAVAEPPIDFGLAAPLNDFWTLASARSLIMANSTFSWWPAMLGDRLHAGARDRRVVAPRPWLPGYPPFQGYGSHWLQRDAHFAGDGPRVRA